MPEKSVSNYELLDLVGTLLTKLLRVSDRKINPINQDEILIAKDAINTLKKREARLE
jgi:hypothetical protein